MKKTPTLRKRYSRAFANFERVAASLKGLAVEDFGDGNLRNVVNEFGALKRSWSRGASDREQRHFLQLWNHVAALRTYHAPTSEEAILLEFFKYLRLVLQEAIIMAVGFGDRATLELLRYVETLCECAIRIGRATVAGTRRDLLKNARLCQQNILPILACMVRDYCWTPSGSLAAAGVFLDEMAVHCGRVRSIIVYGVSAEDVTLNREASTDLEDLQAYAQMERFNAFEGRLQRGEMLCPRDVIHHRMLNYIETSARFTEALNRG